MAETGQRAASGESQDADWESPSASGANAHNAWI
jgi:hypothetical protein